MKRIRWQRFQNLRELLKETAPPPAQMALRLQSMERDIILPVKAVAIGLLFYYLYFTRWVEDAASPRYVAQQVAERFFIIYLLLNVGVAAVLIFSGRLPLLLVQRIIFSSNFMDGLFLAALTFVTGGFDSILYWMFLGLIVRNAVSSPLAVPQLILNFSAIFCYLLAGVLDVTISHQMIEFEEDVSGTAENPTEPFLLRLIVLWLWALCCYGVQVLFEKQRLASEEEREFVARQQQLRSAGRLAAQIAHQIKNPLGIINNAAYSLQKAIQGDKNSGLQQLQIIREEVERSDRIITKLMGYAQLAEGKVEKLQISEELDRAIAEVFPAGTANDVTIQKDYSSHLPSLLMQRGHLGEILVNLLQNAREAVGEGGRISVNVRPGQENSIIITISDDGPGIPNDRLEKIVQPYFSTKEKGTGLGLSIVRHNAEIYGGTVRVESELGKGSKFTVHLPTRTFMKLQT